MHNLLEKVRPIKIHNYNKGIDKHNRSSNKHNDLAHDCVPCILYNSSVVWKSKNTASSKSGQNLSSQ